MKERPIIFNGETVRAILDGRKTQTRRVIKPEWSRCLDLEDPEDARKAVELCPYGQPGDRLWVREAWQYITKAEHEHWTHHRPKDGCAVEMLYRADAIKEGWEKQCYWVPSIHMFRWMSRITLEIVKVRVERVQEIIRDDAFSEGIEAVNPYEIVPDLPVGFPAAFKDYQDPKNFFTADPVASFRSLWNSINAKRGYGWEVNPWVWVIKFRKVERA